MKKPDFLAFLLAGRTGKWDVIKEAKDSTGDTIRLIAILLAVGLSSAPAFALIYILVSR